jgi:nucleotide-binding universal stress UspA family protein
MEKIMYRSILVPLDGSSFGEQALPLAVSVARRAGAVLQLVHVHAPVIAIVEEGLASVDQRLDRAAKARSQAYLDQVVKRTSGVPVFGKVVEGPIADGLQAHAAATDAALVVMTTHGRGGLARAWLGSVADDLIRRLTVPILLVRPQETTPEPAHEAIVQHVLIPLDGSEVAEQVLEPAVALGALMDVEYTLVRVIPPLVVGSHPLHVGPAPGVEYKVVKELRTLHEEEQRTAAKYLEEIAGRLAERQQGGRPLRVQTRIVTDDQPALAILAEAKALPDGLIAVETHGRSGMARLLLGSVADKVVRGSTLPVLVHRSVRN